MQKTILGRNRYLWLPQVHVLEEIGDVERLAVEVLNYRKASKTS